MDLKKYPNIQREFKKYIELEDYFYKKDSEYNKSLIKFNCAECDKYSLFPKTDIREWFLECDGCKNQKKMRVIVEEYCDAYDKLEAFKKGDFPKIIFNDLIKENPYVFEQKDKNFLKFNEVFGNSFSDVPEKMMIHLVGLITETVGRYRLKLK